MRRRIFSLVSLLSLLLCLATVVLWVLSYRYEFVLTHYGHGSHTDIKLGGGKVIVFWDHATYNTTGVWTGGVIRWVDDPSNAFETHRFLGFYSQFVHGTDFRWHEIGIPMWSILLCCSGVFRLLYRKAETPKGLCSSCHYNLTGNTSGVCPECGTAVPHKAGATT